MIHTVKDFSVVNEAEVDVFLEFSCFSYDPTDVGNLLSGSSAFSKSSLNISKFSVHVLLKPSLENFEHYFASMWDECNCVVGWTFFGIAFLWDWNENWPFPVLWPLLSFPNLLVYWVQHFHSISCCGNIDVYMRCASARSLSHVQLFATPGTLAHQASLSMRFFRQEYWSRLLFPLPGDLPKPGIKPKSPASSALAGGFFTAEPPGKPHRWDFCSCCSVSKSCLTLCSPMYYTRPPCPSLSPGVCSMFIESVTLSNHLTLCNLLPPLPSIFLSIRE